MFWAHLAIVLWVVTHLHHIKAIIDAEQSEGHCFFVLFCFHSNGKTIRWCKNVIVHLLSHVQLFSTPWTVARLLCPWDFPGKNTRMGYHFLLQGIFLTQRSNLHLPHWQVDSLPLSHQGSPRHWFVYYYYSHATRHDLSFVTSLCTLHCKHRVLTTGPSRKSRKIFVWILTLLTLFLWFLDKILWVSIFHLVWFSHQ